ncbi:FAD-dependent oxidoreductase [Ornithinibacillus scapharcae]|uniref:FAD-dependent oxidoreductase n=1 Tax=Ornithinibacillus scapharcae TaxID=1147159 RepID=UPI000225AA93|nr:FAD-dependent oxidoreductase [Ornithinibacillus scapharcae]
MNSFPKYYERVNRSKGSSYNATLIVYGATPAGITAAIQAKKLGIDVLIAEFSNHLGGITANGLGATDFGAKEAIGGLSREFYKRVGKYYGKDEQWTFEPKVAKKVFQEWLESYGIPVYFKQHLQDVLVEKGMINMITMEDGNSFQGSHFIDASYEGDLLAKAGVHYHVGRESNETYGESYNGVQFGHPHHQFKNKVDPYVTPGKPESGLLFGITEIISSEQNIQGAGDNRIQAYNFRLCLTKESNNRIPFPKPPKYQKERYELLLRYIKTGVWDAMNLHTMLPNGKTDLNNYGGFSTDYIGMNHNWPEASYEEREEMFQDHLNYQLGMLYFLANDARVPQAIRNEVAEWGLAKDEFVESRNWPEQLYIREGRRMIADYVMTDRNCLGKKVAEDSIGLASYQMDSHHCRRVVMDGRVLNEGDVEIPISPYPISLRAVLPRKEECRNLLVPVCVSSSHIAYGSIRMEPVFMIIGQSVGAVVAMAAKQGIPVQDVPYQELRSILVQEGQVLEWNNTMEDDPVKRMQETFGRE